MGFRVSAAQAAWLVGHGERMVRWHIQTRKDLPAVKAGRSWAIDVDALEAIPGWRVNRERLAELQAADAQTAASMAARITELERSVRELRGRLARLEAQSGASASVASESPHASAPDDRQAASAYGGAIGIPKLSDLPYSAFGDDLSNLGVSRPTYNADSPYPPRRAVPTMRLSSALPDGLVSWRAFAKLHHMPETTVQKAIDGGRLPAMQGSWKAGRVIVRHALDADGRRAFYALWGDRPDFERCAECPH